MLLRTNFLQVHSINLHLLGQQNLKDWDQSHLQCISKKSLATQMSEMIFAFPHPINKQASN